MSPRLVVALVLLVGPCLTGCSLLEPGPSFASVATAPVAPDQTRLVVYRPPANHLLEAVGGRAVAIDGGPACALSEEHFFVHDGPPGAVTIADGASSLALTTAPGAQYYVRIAFNPQRGSLVGWISPLVTPVVSPMLGLPVTEPAPGPMAGMFAIETVDAANAGRELARLTLDADCH